MISFTTGAIRSSLTAAVVTVVTIQAAYAESFCFRHEHILGTSLELVFECSDRQTAIRAETAALAEIDRLTAVLSGYRADSEFSRWMNGDLNRDVGEDLRVVLERAEYWRRKSSGAFDVRAEAVKRLYEQKLPPTFAQRQALISQLEQAPHTDAEKLSRRSSLPISLDALAKGYILDKVCEAVLETVPQADGCLVNIGGDARVGGGMVCDVDITNPLDASENAAPIASVRLTANQALATSGTYRRSVGAEDRKVSHIFDPRTALPVNQMLSVSVIACSGIDADALATTMSVLSATQSISLADRSGAACLLLDAHGHLHVSSRWPDPGKVDATRFVAADEKGKVDEVGLKLEFTLAANNQGGRYRRPYVAVWLEDKEGFPVKTAVLWLQTAAPGPRWHRDLTRWYRNDRIRKLAEDNDLVETISGATRGPGEYSARFNGTDNSGKPLPDGEYVLCIEVAREHGTYQIIREIVTWGENAIEETELKPNAEVSEASYTFEPVRSLQ